MPLDMHMFIEVHAWKASKYSISLSSAIGTASNQHIKGSFLRGSPDLQFSKSNPELAKCWGLSTLELRLAEGLYYNKHLLLIMI